MRGLSVNCCKTYLMHGYSDRRIAPIFGSHYGKQNTFTAISKSFKGSLYQPSDNQGINAIFFQHNRSAIRPFGQLFCNIALQRVSEWSYVMLRVVLFFGKQ
jgi:hypothetical protein